MGMAVQVVGRTCMSRLKAYRMRTALLNKALRERNHTPLIVNVQLTMPVIKCLPVRIRVHQTNQRSHRTAS